MKLNINRHLILISLLFCFCLETFSEQSTSILFATSKVSLNQKNASLKEIFDVIEQQTGLVFIYNNNEFDNRHKVDVNVESESIEKTLQKALEGTGMTYTVNDKYIVLKKKESDKNSNTTQTVTQNTRQITGKIVDINGMELIGVSVSVKSDTKIGSLTDLDGKFSLSVPENAVLVIRYVGYKNKEVAVLNQTHLDIVLEEDDNLLNEVVVIGFGTQKKANLTGAVSSVKMDDVVGVRPSSSAGALLQGIVPGLQVTNGSGEPGGGVSMNIRGTTSLVKDSEGKWVSSSQGPLIVVDNVPINGPLSLINPTDIETITVLKDGGSAAIYGARSAFGVVLITTKSGQKGKAKFNYTANVAFSKPTTLPKKASPLQTVQAYKDAGYSSYYTGHDVDTWLEYLHEYGSNPSLYPEGYATAPNGTQYWLKGYDQIKDFLSETGFQQIHNLSASGGTENISYRISLSYTDSDGTMVTSKDSYEKYTGRSFVSAKLTNWLKGEADMAFYRSTKRMPNAANYQEAVTLPSYTPLGSIDINGTDYLLGTPANRVRLGGINKTKYIDSRITGRLIATPIKDLVITGEYTYDDLGKIDKNYSKRFQYANATKFDPEWSRAYSTFEHRREDTEHRTLNIYGNYSLQLKDHGLKFMVGYNNERITGDYLKATADEMISNEIPGISPSTGEKKPTDGFSEYSVMGFFGRLSYNYKDRYLIDFNGRFDGSSKFPSGERWGFFPSVSAAWRVTQEPFMEFSQEILSDMKFRVSYATVGNQGTAGIYGYLPVMGDYRPTWLHENQQVISLYNPSMIRQNFTWETIETLNAGIDLALLKNRLFVNFDLYRRTTKDMLYDGLELPAVVGSPPPLQNVADLKTQGFELEMKWRDKIGNVNYNIGFHLYNYNAWVTKIRNEAGVLSSFYQGQRIGSIWGYITDRYYTEDDFDEKGNLKEGIPYPKSSGNPNPGDVLFVDLDGNGTIDSGSNTLSNPGDRKVIGNNSLRMQYGINGGVAWNGFDFSFFIEGVGKRDLWLSNDLRFPYYYEFGTIYRHQLNYWTPDNTNAEFPRLYERGMRSPYYESNVRTQTKYLLNGAYMRVKNITLGYQVPQNKIAKTGLNALRFYVSIENPFMFDHLPKGMDPTIANKGNGLGYPFMRTTSFGLSLDF